MGGGCLVIVLAGLAFSAVVYFLSEIVGMSDSAALFLTIIACVCLLVRPHIVKSLKEQNEAEKAKRLEKATALIKRANEVIANCEVDQKTANSFIPRPEVKSIELHNRSWHILDNISFNIQILENTFKEIKARGRK